MKKWHYCQYKVNQFRPIWPSSSVMQSNWCHLKTLLLFPLINWFIKQISKSNYVLFVPNRHQAPPDWHTQLFVVFYVDIFSHLNGNKSWELYKQVRAVLKTYSQPLYSMFCKYFSEFQNISKLYFSLVYRWYLVFVYLHYPVVLVFFK